jgi:glycosyltransferase involved in cell wall biosynthesis
MAKKIKKKKKKKFKPADIELSKAPVFIKDPKKKIKLVYYGDAPPCATGFATVSKNILTGLHQTGKFDIRVLGINYWGDPHQYPFPIWPVGTNPDRDPYGRKKVCQMIASWDFDMLFFLQDSFILTFIPELITHLKSQGREFVSMCYFPIDGVPKKEWIDAVTAVDVPVTYTKFGYEECVKLVPGCADRLKVIPHGANPQHFFPMPVEKTRPFRTQYFGPQAEHYIYMNLNRNQQRKDIPRTMHAFSEIHKEDPKTLLYLHMAMQDQGWNLPEVAKSFGLNPTGDVIFPQGFGPNQGFPLETLNVIYNACDCVVSTTLGEGWGLSWVEAMATKTPVIMPNNTAMAEHIGEDHGYLINSGVDPNLHVILPNDNEVLRPTADINHMVELMRRVKENPDEAREKAENAYNYVMNNFIWEKHIVPQWIDLIEELLETGPEKAEEQKQPEEQTILTESF